MFFTFPLPQIRILACHGKKWTRTNVYSLFFSYTFFPFFPIHKSQFRGILVKNGVGPPLFVYIFFLSPNPNSETLWDKMVLDPNRTGCSLHIHLWQLVCLGITLHTPMRFDGSGSKRYVTNIFCSKMLDHSNRYAH